MLDDETPKEASPVAPTTTDKPKTTTSTAIEETTFYPTGADAGVTDTTLTIDEAQRQLDEVRTRYFIGRASKEEFDAAKANVVSARAARRR